MDLAEYFRIPSSQRLSRLCLTNRLNRLSKAKGLNKTITPVTVGHWVRSNKIPEWWLPIATEIMNSPEVYKQTSSVVVLNKMN